MELHSMTNESIDEQASDVSETGTLSTEGPLVERPRPPRRSVVSRSTVVWGTALAAFALLLIGAAVWHFALARVAVPDLVGTTEGIARTQLAREGLHIASTERRFDESPAGTVLAQDPASGTVVRRGSGIALVVSAGTEEFVMPDVVGMSINLARAQLEQQGLVVRIEAVPSDEPVDTVLETIPAAGAVVRTSDVIRVRIAAEGTATNALLPFDLSGAIFVIDPSPSADGEVDAPLEVARRLRSLLEASGARVVVTRSVTETSVTEAARAERAEETTPHVTGLIGLEAPLQPPGGIAILSVDGVPPASQLGLLIDELALTLGEDERPVLRSSVAADPVLDSVLAPAVRIRLGSYAVREDVAAFRDPTWSDTIARAIYRALGERFASQ